MVGGGTFTVFGNVVTLILPEFPCDCLEWDGSCDCDAWPPSDTCACEPGVPFDLVWFIVDANTLVNALGINWVR